MEEEGPRYPDKTTVIDEETEVDEFEMQTKRKGDNDHSHLDMA